MSIHPSYNITARILPLLVSFGVVSFGLASEANAGEPTAPQAAEASPAAAVLAGYDRGFVLSSPDGKNSLRFVGLLTAEHALEWLDGAPGSGALLLNRARGCGRHPVRRGPALPARGRLRPRRGAAPLRQPGLRRRALQRERPRRRAGSGPPPGRGARRQQDRQPLGGHRERSGGRGPPPRRRDRRGGRSGEGCRAPRSWPRGRGLQGPRLRAHVSGVRQRGDGTARSRPIGASTPSATTPRPATSSRIGSNRSYATCS